MPTIDLRDTTIYYERSGKGEIPLFFIHGMCGSAWNWEDQIQRLSNRFTCIAYDRRGHSRSAPGAEDQSDRTHADDAVALIDALGIDRPVIVASSGGAVVAVELLHRYPDSVRGAVLSEPPLFSIDPEAGKALSAEIGPLVSAAMESGGPRAAVDAFFSLICDTYWPTIDETGKERFFENAPLLVETLQRDATTVSASDLTTIEVPVLVVTGARSHPLARSISEQLAEGLPNGRLIELEDSGHVTYAEQPLGFAGLVTDFARTTSVNRPVRI